MLRREIVAWRTGTAILLASAASFGQAQTGATVKVDAPTPVAPIAEPEPSRHVVELGIFGGMMFPSPDHALFQRLPREEFDSPAPEIGFRASLLPWSYIGIEAEGAAMPTNTASGADAGL